MVIGKFISGKLFQIVAEADTVSFSSEKGWICVCYDFQQPERKKQHFEWVKADSPNIVWVRDFFRSQV